MMAVRCAHLLPIQVSFGFRLLTSKRGELWPENERGTWREEQRRIQREKKVHVSKVLSAEYTEEAFRIPVSDYFIWDIIRDGMEHYGGKDRFNTGVDDFLWKFFADAIVGQVQQHFQFCARSFLGTEYSFRRGKVELATIVGYDAMETLASGPLGPFLGEPSIEEQEEEIDEGIYSLDDYLPETPETGKQSRLNAPENRYTRNNRKCLAEAVDVEFAWSSETLSERSSIFASKVAAQIPEANCRHRYELKDFDGRRSDTVNMYRGIKLTWLQGGLSRNLFNPQICITNSLRHAYEHPQHTFPLFSKEPVAVFVFEINTAVLHGYKPPEDGGPKFTVRFIDRYAELYAEVIGSIERTVLPPEVDILIMPDCIPCRNGGVVKLVYCKDAEMPLAQVVFCSDRAIEWLQNQVKLIIHEVRKD